MVIFWSVIAALIDAFGIYSASATAVNIILRDITGATMPLFGLQMYATMGLGWGNTLIACFSVLMIPAAFMIIKYGEHLRTTYPVKNI